MTDNQQQPKIKFKKRNIIKKKHLRKVAAAAQTTTTHNDDTAADSEQHKSNNDIPAENIDEEKEEGALTTILAVDRRRKLLNNRNRGVDSTHLLKPIKSSITTATNTTDDNTTTNVDTNKNKDLEERLKGTFSEGKLAGSNDMGGDDEGGILAKKHKKAMEEYIEQNLQGAGVTEAATKTAATDDTGPNEDDKELFAEL